MARPNNLQELSKGKILCGKTAPDFADTWNYVVKRLENLKGDGDVAGGQQGRIRFDVTNPEHPIIRYVDPAAQGAGNGLPPGYSMVKACELDLEQMAITNVYIKCEEFLYGDGGTVGLPRAELTGGVIYLSMLGYGGTISCGIASSVTDMQRVASDTTRHYFPLYVVSKVTTDDGEQYAITDLRCVPTGQSWMVSSVGP
jgi:Fe-S cluster biogenesis protein NfuA